MQPFYNPCLNALSALALKHQLLLNKVSFSKFLRLIYNKILIFSSTFLLSSKIQLQRILSCNIEPRLSHSLQTSINSGQDSHEQQNFSVLRFKIRRTSFSSTMVTNRLFWLHMQSYLKNVSVPTTAISLH